MQELPLDLYTAAQVRAFDRHLIEELGVPGYELMCRAGQAAFARFRELWPRARRLIVVCGGGNNGGDGYVFARLAHGANLQVEVQAVTDPARLKGDARRAFEDCAAAGVTVRPFDAGRLTQAEVLIDAIFGTGLDRPLDETARSWVQGMNASARAILALDLPSGLHADTGTIMGAAVRATATISFMALKLGSLVNDGPDCTGFLFFDDLQAPIRPAALSSPAAERLDPKLIGRALPPRRRNVHKGDFGRVLIIAGGPGMPGAARLCGEACLRAGAGLVTVATRPENIVAIVAGRPELICHGIEQPQAIEPLLAAADVVAVGPGLGTDAWARGLWERALGAGKQMVLDADALNLLAQTPQALSKAHDTCVLTPHPGEAGRLLGLSVPQVQENRPAALNRLVELYDGTVVLKGSGTLIGARDRITAICDRGNPGMATAGVGDVLTGIIAAMLTQIADAWEAVRVAVLVHAMAGDAAAVHKGWRGLIAGDLIGHLPECLNSDSN